MSVSTGNSGSVPTCSASACRMRSPDRVAVPAGHDRRPDDQPGVELDRTGHRQARAAHRRGRPAGGGQQFGEPAAELVQHLLRDRRPPAVRRTFRQDRAGQVEDGRAGVGGVQVGREHHGVAGVEGQPHRRPAAGGQLAGGGGEPARGEELVQPVADRRPGQPGEALEFAAGAGLSGTDQFQQVSRGAPGRCHPVDSPCVQLFSAPRSGSRRGTAGRAWNSIITGTAASNGPVLRTPPGVPVALTTFKYWTVDGRSADTGRNTGWTVASLMAIDKT